MKPLHGEAGRAAGEVEPARERLAPARAAARGATPRPEPRGERPDGARGSDGAAAPRRRPCARRAGRAGPRSSSIGTPTSPSATLATASSAREQRRDVIAPPASSRRIRTNAIAHSDPDTNSASMPTSEAVISRMTPGEITLSSTIAPMPMPATTPAREHRARQQRADLAQQVLARVERAAQLGQRPHRVAAGALLDHERRHEHAELARRQPLAERLERRRRPAGRRAAAHDRAHLLPPRARAARARRAATAAGEREPRRRAVGQHAREVGQLGDERRRGAGAGGARPSSARRPRRSADAEHERDEPRRAEPNSSDHRRPPARPQRAGSRRPRCSRRRSSSHAPAAAPVRGSAQPPVERAAARGASRPRPSARPAARGELRPACGAAT